MATWSRKRRKRRIRKYAIAGALLCAAIALAVWAFMRQAENLSAAPAALPDITPSPTAVAAQATVQSPGPEDSGLKQAQTETAQASPGAAQTPAATAAQVTPGTASTPGKEAAEGAALQQEEGVTAASVRTAPAPTPPVRKSELERSLYQGRLAFIEGQALGALSLTYVNHGADTLYALYFHLYPNVQSPGSLSITRVALNGVRAYHLYERSGAILIVPLINELRSGEAARVYIEFAAKIPPQGFGYARTAADATAQGAAAENAHTPAAVWPDGALPLVAVFPTIALYENGWIQESAPHRVDYAPLADWRLIVQSERVPGIEGGGAQALDSGGYFLQARAAVPVLWLE